MRKVSSLILLVFSVLACSDEGSRTSPLNEAQIFALIQRDLMTFTSEQIGKQFTDSGSDKFFTNEILCNYSTYKVDRMTFSFNRVSCGLREFRYTNGIDEFLIKYYLIQGVNQINENSVVYLSFFFYQDTPPNGVYTPEPFSNSPDVNIYTYNNVLKVGKNYYSSFYEFEVSHKNSSTSITLEPSIFRNFSDETSTPDVIPGFYDNMTISANLVCCE
ncbi:MAG: hypothetical protein J0L67_12885 [Cytophagales bacterium]|nr:hypothetical protein [Cytophagales bacterium]